jgi:hypothetical protein
MWAATVDPPDDGLQGLHELDGAYRGVVCTNPLGCGFNPAPPGPGQKWNFGFTSTVSTISKKIMLISAQ